MQDPIFVYCYDRMNGTIDKFEVSEIDRCAFYLFEYKGQKCHFNTRDSQVQVLHRASLCDATTVLVSDNRRSIVNIKESDEAVRNLFRSKLTNTIHSLFEKEEQ